MLRRLADAVAAGSRVLGVIRGVGLSNDGRGRGLLAPSEEGQERAIRLALHGAGLAPADIGLVECHATGTPVGDATEIRSMARVYQGCADVPIGSLKSNLGHLITAAGVAGLIKVLAAMEHGLRPPTLHAEEPIDALHGTPFRLLHAAEPWDGPRRAALSAFGFGGNNAHLIVEAWDEFQARGRHVSVPAPAAIAPEPIAIVGIGARVADGESVHDFADALFDGEARHEPRATVTVALEGLRSPPADLADALAQQTLVLEAAREATQEIALPRERTSVLVGMGCDPEIARYGARWRVAEWAAAWAEGAGDAVDPEWLRGRARRLPVRARGRGCGRDDAEHPGEPDQQPARRRGPVVHGLRGGGLGARRPRRGRARAPSRSSSTPPSSARWTCRTRWCTSRRSNRWGTGAPPATPRWCWCSSAWPTRAATGTRSTRCSPRTRPPPRSPSATPPAGSISNGSSALPTRPRGCCTSPRARSRCATARDRGSGRGPRPGSASAASRSRSRRWRRRRGRCGSRRGTAWRGRGSTHRRGSTCTPVAIARGALVALEARRESDAGPARLVLVAADGDELAARADAAQRWLRRGGPPPEGVAFRERPVDGELAFVFTGAAAAYPGMARDLALGLPGLVDAVAARCEEMHRSTDWLYGAGDGTPAHPLDQLWGTSFVCQLHAELSRGLLGLSPRATLGYSSGESNALFALGAWTDLDAMIRESRAGTIFTRELAGAFDAPRRAWARLGLRGETWVNYIVSAPVEHVRAALAGEPLAHLTIINTPEDCVIGGEAAACERVLARLGRERALPLGYDIAAHCPELQEVHAEWRALHHRETRDVPGVRFYTHATGSWFHPTADAAADAITGQATRTLDFPRLVEQAWADGVRVFVEHGPRGLCSGWIKRILGERDHIAVPLDVQGRSGLRQAMNAAAWLRGRRRRRACTRAGGGALGLAAAAARPGPAADPGCARAGAAAPRVRASRPGDGARAAAPAGDPMWAAPVVDAPPGRDEDRRSRARAGAAPSTDRADLRRPRRRASAGVALAPARRTRTRWSATSSSSGRCTGTSCSARRTSTSASSRCSARRRRPCSARTAPCCAGRRRARPQRSPRPPRSPSSPRLRDVAGDRAGSDDTGASDRGAGRLGLRRARCPGRRSIARSSRSSRAAGSRRCSGPRSPARTATRRQVRMPEPPLLLADRVTGIDATPGRRSAPARSGPRPTSARTAGT